MLTRPVKEQNTAQFALELHKSFLCSQTNFNSCEQNKQAQVSHSLLLTAHDPKVS